MMGSSSEGPTVTAPTALLLAAYPHLTLLEVSASVAVEPVQVSGDLPTGVALDWHFGAGTVELKIRNDAAAPVELDWNRCTFVDATGVSSGVAPGFTTFGEMGQLLPPTVVPSGARVDLVLVSKAAVNRSEAEVAPMFDFLAPGSTFSVTLAWADGGSTRYHTSAFAVATDVAALAALESQRAAEEKRRAALLARCGEPGKHRSNATVAALAGGGGAAFLGLALVPDENNPDLTLTTGATVFFASLATVSLGAGAVGYFYEQARAREAERELRDVRCPSGR